MSKYYIYAIILNDCGYSTAAKDMLDKFTNIKKKYVFINYNEAEKYTNNLIKTFPQIYLKKENNSSSLLLGGYTDLEQFVNTFHNNYNENDINIFKKKNPLWSKKAILRLIELINKK
jgi:hypothetical protein